MIFFKIFFPLFFQLFGLFCVIYLLYDYFFKQHEDN